MKVEIKIPRVGAGGNEVLIRHWFVKAGDQVEKDASVVAIESGFLSMEISAPVSGTVEAILAPEGQKVSAGTVIASVIQSIEEPLEQEPLSPPIYTEEQQDEVIQPSEEEPEMLEFVEEEELLTPPTVEPEQIRPEPSQPEQNRIDFSTLDFSQHRSGTKGSTLNVNWAAIEVDMSSVVACRQAFEQRVKEGEANTVNNTSLILFVLARTLTNYPRINSIWKEGSPRHIEQVNIHVNSVRHNRWYGKQIPDADRKSVEQMATALEGMGVDSDGPTSEATFTFKTRSNLGCLLGQEKIHYPQVATLSMEKLIKRPVVVSVGNQDSISIKPMTNIVISFDLRVVDSLTAAAFLRELKGRLEALSDTPQFD